MDLWDEMGLEVTTLDKYGCEPFTGRNFPNFSYITKGILRENGVEECIRRPPRENDKIQIQKDMKCMLLLVKLFGEQAVEMAEDCGNSREVWVKIKNEYKEQDVHRILSLKRKFKNFKFDTQTSLRQQLDEYDTLVKNMKEAYLLLSEEDVAINLLLSMPRPYKKVIAEIRCIALDDLTLRFVKEKLLNEENEILIKLLNNQVKKIHQAVLIRNIDPQLDKRGYFMKVQKGQYMPLPQGNDTLHPSTTTDEKCNQTMEGEELEEGTIAHADESTNEHNPALMLLRKMEHCNFLECTNKKEIEFVLDSGSSVHVTKNKEYLHSFTTLKEPLKISVGKEKEFIKAKGKGNLKICFEVNTGERFHYTIKDVHYVKKSKRNCLSVNRFDDEGFKTFFCKGEAKLELDGNVVASCLKGKNKLYIMKLSLIKPGIATELGEYSGF